MPQCHRPTVSGQRMQVHGSVASWTQPTRRVHVVSTFASMQSFGLSLYGGVGQIRSTARDSTSGQRALCFAEIRSPARGTHRCCSTASAQPLSETAGPASLSRSESAPALQGGARLRDAEAGPALGPLDRAVHRMAGSPGVAEEVSSARFTRAPCQVGGLIWTSRRRSAALCEYRRLTTTRTALPI